MHNVMCLCAVGGEVLFEVDCTRLSECVCLRGRQFDRVIFNFPHCGRKSGVTKNRLLLKHFFLSCVGVLKEEGEVLVSLCNGQGGTPADRPMREWHNSWQVVAMAAEAGLILNEVRPFDSEKPDGYQSTGEGEECVGEGEECVGEGEECVGEGEECVGEGEECVGVGGYVLRPSLLEREEVLHGVSGLVFQRVPISPWSPPAFHQLLLWGAWPKASQSIPDLGRSLQRLLTPYGLSLTEEQGSLWLAAEPMGRLGRLWADDLTDDVSVCLNLDLLASLVYSLPDWRLLWSPDPRFLNHFLLRPLPEQPFHPFSLFPQSFVYDISFWAGPDWQEAEFHALVREASRETVENVTLIDTYTPNTQTDTHPDITHTSYCYRLTYRSHTHALSHTLALKRHTHLQGLLSTRMHLTVR
uniref:Ferredoxin-fold anticodon binding domain containing 1 n=1 Tax=Hucho hucho TaxID=62062 RepID=A0A4W5M9I3_9TELE